MRHVSFSLLALSLASLLFMPISLFATKRLSIAPLYYDTHNVCTAFSINEPAALWATAAHCVRIRAVDVDEDVEDVDETESPSAPAHTFTVQDQVATVVVVMVDDDLAVLKTPKGVSALSLATREPRIGDTVRVVGFPLGGEQVIQANGTIANPHYMMNNRFTAWFAIPVCQGHSGSPVLDRHGDVLSVFQLMPSVPCAPYAIGPAWEVLSQRLVGFFEQR